MLLSARELELQLCGAPVVDVKAWKRSCVYRGDFDVQRGNPFAPLHPVVQFFWDEVESWSDEQRALLLLWCTGSSRPPALWAAAPSGPSRSRSTTSSRGCRSARRARAPSAPSAPSSGPTGRRASTSATAPPCSAASPAPPSSSPSTAPSRRASEERRPNLLSSESPPEAGAPRRGARSRCASGSRPSRRGPWASS